MTVKFCQCDLKVPSLIRYNVEDFPLNLNQIRDSYVNGIRFTVVDAVFQDCEGIKCLLRKY